MLSAFKDSVNVRLRLLWINTVNTWQAETAYFGDTWGNVLSTVMYTLTYLIFIEVIFTNTKILAGYTRNEMLFLLFIIQINFYLIFTWSYNNVVKMVDDVNLGTFDLILIKPLPALYYTSIRNITLISTLRDAVPSLLIIALVINWSQIHVAPIAVVAGISIIICGQIAMNTFFFLLGLPVFWFGQAADLLGLSYSFMSNNLPFEGLGKPLKLALTSLIPCLLASSFAASVMLGRTDTAKGIIYALFIAIGALIIKTFVWRLALRNYTSASS